MSESQRVFSSTAPPPLGQGHPEACRGRGRGWQRGRVGATDSSAEDKSWQREKAPPPSKVSLLFLESPSSRQLLGEWQYFHLTETQEEAEVVLLSRTFGGKRVERQKRDCDVSCDEGGQQSVGGGLPKEEEPVLSNSESAEMVGRILKDVWQLPGGVGGQQGKPILPSYQQLCSSSETLLPTSIEEFLTAPSSLAIGSSSMVAQDEDFYSASSSLDMDMGRPQIIIDSASDFTGEEEEEEEEGISEESESWSRGENPEDKFCLATPTYVGRRQLELEEGSVSLSLYSEGGLTGWGAEGRWGGQLAGVDILGLVIIISSLLLALIFYIVSNILQVYREEEELCAVLQRAEGAISYVERYWAGFFPLLLFQLAGEGEEVGTVGDMGQHLVKELAVLAHRVVVGQGRAEREWGLEAAARLHLHNSTCFNVEETGGSLENPSWVCPGPCHLQALNPRRRPARTGKRRRNFLQSVRKTIAARRIRRQP